MRVETSLPFGNWRSDADAARRAEESGFDGVTSFEIGHDPFAPLVLAATVTERLRLGTAIAVCFPRSPMVMANIPRDTPRAACSRPIVRTRGSPAIVLVPGKVSADDVTVSDAVRRKSPHRA